SRSAQASAFSYASAGRARQNRCPSSYRHHWMRSSTSHPSIVYASCRGSRQVSASYCQGGIAGRGLYTYEVLPCARGINRNCGVRDACALGIDAQRRVVLESAKHSLIRTTLSEMDGPWVQASR